MKSVKHTYFTLSIHFERENRTVLHSLHLGITKCLFRFGIFLSPFRFAFVFNLIFTSRTFKDFPHFLFKNFLSAFVNFCEFFFFLPLLLSLLLVLLLWCAESQNKCTKTFQYTKNIIVSFVFGFVFFRCSFAFDRKQKISHLFAYSTCNLRDDKSYTFLFIATDSFVCD